MLDDLRFLHSGDSDAFGQEGQCYSLVEVESH